VTASARHQPNDLGNDDLPARGGVAEPRGFDDRSAEEVAALLCRFSRGETDADAKRIPVCAAPGAVGRLLHGNGAGDGACRAVEAQHQAVASGLHFRAAVLRHSRAQRGEVLVAQRFICVVAQPAGLPAPSSRPDR
jgi:hypothetical protein